jgi:ABC-type bacteriocin/lantibiotic exporter with double-glycine peptidase domain
MFKLAFFANPARLKREFLALDNVAPEAKNPELAAEFAKLRQQSPDLLMGGNFWWDFVRTFKNHLSRLVVGRIVMVLFVLVSVLASQRILDDANTMTAAIWLLVFYTVVQVVLKIVNAFTSVLQSQLYVSSRTFVTLRLNVKLLRMGELSSDEFSTGNLKTLLSSDVYRIGDFLHGVSRNGLPCILSLLLLGPVIVYYMGWPGVIAMVVGFGSMPLAFYLGGYVHRKEKLIKQQEDKLSTIVGEWVINVRLLRFLGWERLMQTKVAGHVRSLVIESTRQHAANLVNFGVSVTWWLMPIIALIGSSELLGGEQDVVTLFASIWMLNHITLYIRWLPGIFIDYASAAASVDRLNKLFLHKDIFDDLMPDYYQSVQAAEPTRVHLSNVSFSYKIVVGEVDANAITDLFLTLELDKHTSLIGKVGAGKSTLLKLICGELKPTAGIVQVEFDNGVVADLWHNNIYHRYREHIGFMPQEAYLSNTTLAVNISLDDQHDDQDVMRAVQMAELVADIDHWQSGLGEEVGETGVNLSGGQRQRVNLARALYSQRPYLVLDDPLSAVDANTEERLMANIMSGPRGFLLCSHRLQELKQTDRLLVLDGGEIIEDGPPLALMNNPDSEFNQHLLAGQLSGASRSTESTAVDQAGVEEKGNV